jgi:hypothetical protein
MARLTFGQKIKLWQKEFIPDPSSPSGIKWKTLDASRKKPRVAGYLNERGYYVVKTHGKEYRCHQIVLALNGVMPNQRQSEADHIDRNPSNNSLSNLRWVSGSQNCKNRKTTGKVPFKYVISRGVKFIARYRHPVTREKIQVGTYDDAYEAHCQALAHRLENHWIKQ